MTEPKEVNETLESTLISENLDNTLINDSKKPSRHPYTYSNPSPEMIEALETQRNKNFFSRLISPMKQGSMRNAVIFFIRMTCGAGIMSLPYYVSQFGLVTGEFMLFLAGILTYCAFIFMFEAQIHTGARTLDQTVRELLPRWIYLTYRYMLCLDLLMPCIVYVVVAWNIATFMLFVTGLYNDSWLIDPYKLEFEQYNPQLFIIRVISLHVIFLLIIIGLLQKSLTQLKFVSVVQLIAFGLLILIFFIQAPFFYKKYHNEEDPDNLTDFKLFKPFFRWDSLTYGFSIILAYYAQPYILSIRNELIQPNYRRLKKISYLTAGFDVALYCLFGGIGYYVFGDKFTPSLLILRKPIELAPALELLFKIVLVVFFLCMFGGVVFFNPTLREHYINVFLIGGIFSILLKFAIALNSLLLKS